MELQLIRSFLEVAESGSFAAASDRLLVTQSAVSLRIQRLEDQLGHPLFQRTKDGVVLTAAGRQFHGHATAMLEIWERARQGLSEKAEGAGALTIAAVPALWPGFGLDWLQALRAARPGLALRAEIAPPEGLSAALTRSDSPAQVALGLGLPPRGAGRIQPLPEDRLILVSPFADLGLQDLPGRYALIDWGPDFMRFQQAMLPAVEGAPVLAQGIATPESLPGLAAAAYLPARLLAPPLASGALHAVAKAPSFGLGRWALWREDLSGDLLNVAQRTLEATAEASHRRAGALIDSL